MKAILLVDTYLILALLSGCSRLPLPPATATITTIPTNTPEPTTTPTVQPTIAPTPKPGDILQVDTFDDNHNHWNLGTNGSPDSSVAVKDGLLVLSMQREEARTSATGSGFYRDESIEFDGTLLEGDNNVSIGAGCRVSQDGSNGYYFNIFGDGYFRIFKVINGSVSALLKDTHDINSDAIHTGKATNHIGVICSGNTLQLIANYHLLATVTDNALSEGAVALFAYNGKAHPTAIVSIDNYVLSAPSQCKPSSDFNLYNLLNPTKDLGKIDGVKFNSLAESIKGARVEIIGTVIESQHYIDSGAGQDWTVLLVSVLGDDGKKYEGVIILQDSGSGVLKFPPESKIDVTGIHLGSMQPPPNIFTTYPNTEGKALPTLQAETAMGGCAP